MTGNTSGQLAEKADADRERTLDSCYKYKGAQSERTCRLQPSMKCSPISQSESALQSFQALETGSAIGSRLANYSVCSLEDVNQVSRYISTESLQSSSSVVDLRTHDDDPTTLKQIEKKVEESEVFELQELSDLYSQFRGKSSGSYKEICGLKDCVSERHFEVKELADRFLNRNATYHLNRLMDDVDHWKWLMGDKIISLYQLLERKNILIKDVAPSLRLPDLTGQQIMQLDLANCHQLANSWPGQFLPETLKAVKYALNPLELKIADIRVCLSPEDRVILKLAIDNANGKIKDLYVALTGYAEDGEIKQFLRGILLPFSAVFMVEHWHRKGACHRFSPTVELDLNGELTGILLSLEGSTALEYGESLSVRINNPEDLYFLGDELPDVKAANWLQCLDQVSDELLNNKDMFNEQAGCQFRFLCSDSGSENRLPGFPTITFLSRFKEQLAFSLNN
ncbi:hypothetical protein [Endozoicomonas elysicola]|uniref:Uncharacterized protein n=1 Tax=Endozoicomonas elysicola TaxID=305900 RepID=A0A081KAL3_9GAMM|nr:hypothetical protein [Endozoicomonas elysicola]KEI71189.1 hypothetical protein GV64_10945 [Endozoicomonas elysicola]